jgi:lipoprotein-anchoring transpeptidase ErfK/SrfK
MRAARHPGLAPLALAIVGALTLAACGASGTTATAPTIAPAPKVQVVSTPAPDAKDVPLDQRITVAVTQGSLKAISISDPWNTTRGVVSPGATSWESGQPLTPTTTYQVKASLLDTHGATSERSWKFTTGAPATPFRATISPGDGATVGVGMPVIVKLNAPVPDAARKDFESRLQVTTNPPTPGAWHWFSPTQLDYRGANYWAPGTTINIVAHINGYHAGGTMWGVRDVTSSYRIGDAHVSVVDVNAHTMTVTNNGAVIRTIPVSTGRDKYPTKGGVHVVSDKSQKVIMDSATVGIPRNSPDGYYETVFWDVRISNSGEFVHAAPWSVGSQGRANVSHGCVNVSTADATWFYNWSLVGDVVQVNGSPDQLEPTNGIGDWQIPWAQWAN